MTINKRVRALLYILLLFPLWWIQRSEAQPLTTLFVAAADGGGQNNNDDGDDDDGDDDGDDDDGDDDGDDDDDDCDIDDGDDDDGDSDDDDATDGDDDDGSDGDDDDGGDGDDDDGGRCITAFCFGDGSAAACPCDNQGAPGRGCANSAFAGGALLAASGNNSLSNDTLVMTASDIYPSSLQILLQGRTDIRPVNFGDGLRCIDDFVRLFQIKFAHVTTVSAPSDDSIPPSPATISGESAAHGDPLSPGSVRGYQMYYRDPVVEFCPRPAGNTFNATNALHVTWGP